MHQTALTFPRLILPVLGGTVSYSEAGVLSQGASHDVCQSRLHWDGSSAQVVTAEPVLCEQLPEVLRAKASHWQPQREPLGRRNLLSPWLG